MARPAQDRRTRGRPREFDRETALDRAVAVFHHKGYAATSLGDLTGAMGITATSLYAAFGSKEGLFREAVMRYRTTVARYIVYALADIPRARDAVANLLAETAAALGREGRARGCLCVLGDQGCHDEALRRFMAEMRAQTARSVTERLQRGQRDGDVPLRAACDRVGLFVATVIAGMSVQARDGAGRAALQRIAEVAMLGVDAALAPA